MKNGIILVNLGTPAQPEKKAVRTFLKHFLSDRRVINWPRLIWLPILYGPILTFRPQKSAKLYQKIWSVEGSPLLVYTKKQTEQLQELLPEQKVYYAMSYSEPTLKQVLAQSEKEGITSLAIVPQYPQYSTTTVGSIADGVADYLLQAQSIPHWRFISDFHADKRYIQLLVKQLQVYLSKNEYQQIIFSYHGIPQAYVKNGDPYQQQCQRTTELVMVHFENQAYQMTYQSKFGPAEWLTPATSAVLKKLPTEGIKKILVLTPGFVVDCLETLEEIEVENRTYFMENGGERFDYCHPFNDDLDYTKFLAQLVKEGFGDDGAVKA